MQLWPAKEKAFAADFGGGLCDVGVRLDDHRRRVPELQQHLLPRRALAERPADLRGAGEADQSHALVLDQDVADLGRAADEHVQPAGRQAGLGLELGEEQGGERRLRSRA